MGEGFCHSRLPFEDYLQHRLQKSRIKPKTNTALINHLIRAVERIAQGKKPRAPGAGRFFLSSPLPGPAKTGRGHLTAPGGTSRSRHTRRLAGERRYSPRARFTHRRARRGRPRRERCRRPGRREKPPQLQPAHRQRRSSHRAAPCPFSAATVNIPEQKGRTTTAQHVFSLMS